MALTHYEVLGVDQDATRAEITSAFRAQMRALHADAGGDDELAKNVSSAFNVLSNAAKRAAYDRTLTQQPRQRTSSTGAAGTTSSPSPAAAAARETVFTADRGSPSFSMMNADPSAWSWHDPAGDDENIAEGSSAGRRSVVRTVGLILAFLAWAAAGAAAASTLGLPLAGVGLLLAIDPILDMGRTAVNVAGQALVPTLVAKRQGMLDQAQYDRAGDIEAIEAGAQTA